FCKRRSDPGHKLVGPEDPGCHAVTLTSSAIGTYAYPVPSRRQIERELGQQCGESRGVADNLRFHFGGHGEQSRNGRMQKRICPELGGLLGCVSEEAG